MEPTSGTVTLPGGARGLIMQGTIRYTGTAPTSVLVLGDGGTIRNAEKLYAGLNVIRHPASGVSGPHPKFESPSVASGQGMLLNPFVPVTPQLRTFGMATALLPAALLGWGLVGLLPALRAIGRGALLPQVGQALHRLGLAVLLVGAQEPLGRMVLFAALPPEPGHLALEIGISAQAVILVCLGATLMALGPVLRSAAAALEENRGFV